jgi:hypothetical protein
MEDIILLFICILLVILLVVNIAFLIKKKDKTENYKLLLPSSKTSSTSPKEIQYIQVLEFDQRLNMNHEIINFSINLENQDLSKYLGAYIKIEGLSSPFSIVLTKNRINIIDPQTHKRYNSFITSYPILQLDQPNNYTLIYKNIKGDIRLELRYLNQLVYENNNISKNIVGIETQDKKVSLSVGSYQPTNWEF